MDDWKKTIKGLEQFKSDFKPYCGNASDWERFDNGLLMLKKAEPVEPRKVRINQAGPLCFSCYCQRCGNPVGNMIGHSVAKIHSNFCDRCGQAVKWE